MDALYFFDPETGDCTCYAGRRGRLSDEQKSVIEAAKCPNEGDLAWWGDYLGTADCVEARIDPETGEITSVEAAPQPIIYAHIALSGGDGEDPPGIEADNAASKLSVSMKLSQSATNPDAGLLGGAVVNQAFRITIRNNGAVYTVQRIQIANNQWSGFFRGKHGSGLLSINQADMADIEVDGIGTVKVVLVGQLAMKVYEEAETE